MGWIRGRHTHDAATLSPQFFGSPDGIKENVQHIEDIHGSPSQEKTARSQNVSKNENSYPMQPKDVSDEQLPLIPRGLVESKRQPNALAGSAIPENPRQDYWIVVDGIVYDCTQFISDHPGGEQVILSFVGEDCSWQFWRFHGKSEMAQYGRVLRIGRTEGITNRFKEPVRFVGLSKFGNDDW